MAFITIDIGQSGQRESPAFTRILIDQNTFEYIWQQERVDANYIRYTFNLPVRSFHAIRVTTGDYDKTYHIQITHQTTKPRKLSLLDGYDLVGHFKIKLDSKTKKDADWG